MDPVEIVEGWTGDIVFNLQEDDGAAQLGTDPVVAQAWDRTRQPVSLTGDLVVVTASEGTVRLNPDTGDFLASKSPYELRFKRTTSRGDVYYPNGEAVKVTVRPWTTGT